MPRYEFSEGSSNKFWQIDLSGKSFTTTYGKIGTSGQTTVKSFGSDADAKKEYDKLIAEKVKKGYSPADGGDDDDDEDEAPAPKKSTKAAAKPAAAAKTASKPAPAAKLAKKASGGTSSPRRFEFSEGSSNKFWTVWVEGTSLMTKYGKIGASGSQTVKDFGTAEKVQKEYDKIVAEKTKKGYEEVENTDD
jgi:predicted DNA-binding WGR domain protein